MPVGANHPRRGGGGEALNCLQVCENKLADWQSIFFLNKLPKLTDPAGKKIPLLHWGVLLIRNHCLALHQFDVQIALKRNWKIEPEMAGFLGLAAKYQIVVATTVWPSFWPTLLLLRQKYKKACLSLAPTTPTWDPINTTSLLRLPWRQQQQVLLQQTN